MGGNTDSARARRVSSRTFAPNATLEADRPGIQGMQLVKSSQTNNPRRRRETRPETRIVTGVVAQSRTPAEVARRFRTLIATGSAAGDRRPPECGSNPSATPLAQLMHAAHACDRVQAHLDSPRCRSACSPDRLGYATSTWQSWHGLVAGGGTLASTDLARHAPETPVMLSRV